VKNVATGKYLTAKPFKQSPVDGQDAASNWTIKPYDDCSYQILAPKADLALDLSSGLATPGASISLWVYIAHRQFDVSFYVHLHDPNFFAHFLLSDFQVVL